MVAKSLVSKCLLFQNEKHNRQNYTGGWLNGTRHGNGTTYFKVSKF